MDRRRPLLIYAIPNLFTAANLYCGFWAIYQALREDYIHACYAILLAGVFDQIDGRVARMTNTQSKFGVEFDSLCDLLTFGLGPAIIIERMLLQEYDRMGFFAAFLFVMCAAIRLARFNVVTDKLPKSYFQGLPVPMAAATCVGVVFLHRDLGELPQVTGVVLLVSMAILMVSTVRYPSFKDFHPRKRRAVTIFVLLTGLAALISVYPEKTVFTVLAAYILWGLAAESFRWAKRGASRKKMS